MLLQHMEQFRITVLDRAEGEGGCALCSTVRVCKWKTTCPYYATCNELICTFNGLNMNALFYLLKANPRFSTFHADYSRRHTPSIRRAVCWCSGACTVLCAGRCHGTKQRKIRYFSFPSNVAEDRDPLGRYAVSIGKLLTDVSKDRDAFMTRAKQFITLLLDCLTLKSKALQSVTVHQINTAQHPRRPESSTRNMCDTKYFRLFLLNLKCKNLPVYVLTHCINSHASIKGLIRIYFVKMYKVHMVYRYFKNEVRHC